jgi:transcription elongation GreA/GreB family factor
VNRETKHQLIEQFLSELRREVDVAETAARTTREGATHEEARPENDKDTRAIEASYLAGAQAERARELKESLAALEGMSVREFQSDDPIALSAFVTVSFQDSTMYYFIAPQAGGLTVQFNGQRVQITTPRAPLGRALIGKTEGDTVEVHTAGTVREYEIIRVD